ncbi:hypothetical protein ALC57_06216 [Trachymyrmex cornetzi]|uniref:Uncharacterized protein n=1 Tax=Trachymyrmex cornetzi TaxID=471704 RepID=A0A195E845_9HYME|nr:hypothetical protein ALC57_06216 [Trachymyrmex cornetzi]
MSSLNYTGCPCCYGNPSARRDTPSFSLAFARRPEEAETKRGAPECIGCRPLNYGISESWTHHSERDIFSRIVALISGTTLERSVERRAVHTTTLGGSFRNSGQSELAALDHSAHGPGHDRTIHSVIVAKGRHATELDSERLIQGRDDHYSHFSPIACHIETIPNERLSTLQAASTADFDCHSEPIHNRSITMHGDTQSVYSRRLSELPSSPEFANVFVRSQDYRIAGDVRIRPCFTGIEKTRRHLEEAKQLKGARSAIDRRGFRRYFFQHERPLIDPGREWSRTSGGFDEDVFAGSCGITCLAAAGLGSVRRRGLA